MHPKHKCGACPLSILYITSYTSSHIYEQFDVHMSRSFFLDDGVGTPR